MKPTNLNDYYSPIQHVSDNDNIWAWGAKALIGLGLSVTIHLNPGVNLQSVGRVLFTSIICISGFKIVRIQSKLDKQVAFIEITKEAGIDKFSRRVGMEVSVTGKLDAHDCAQYLPPARSPQSQPIQQQLQPQCQPEYNESEYQQPGGYSEDLKLDADSSWLEDLMEYPSILVWGAQGSGKSTLIMWLTKKRAKRGHDIEVLNPHFKAGEWRGFQVFGKGMNYEEVDARFLAFDSLMRDRYKQFAKDENFNPQPKTVVVEEFTRYASKCQHSADFFETSLTDIRKVGGAVLYVSHGRTLLKLGGAKGLAQTRDEALLELKLEAKIDHTTKKAVPSGRGWLKYPGMPLKDAIPVRIPDFILPESKEETNLFNVYQSEETDSNSSVWGGDDRAIDSDVVEQQPMTSHTTKPLPHKAHTESHITQITHITQAIECVEQFLASPHTHTPLANGRSRDEILLLFKALILAKVGKIKTILYLWGVNRGGSNPRYNDACDMYMKLLAETAGTETTEFLSQLTTIQFPELRLLPASSGVYFVYDSDYRLYYIGSSNNILLRWNSIKYPHHRLPDVEAIAQVRTIKIGWILTSDYERIEADLIAKFKPEWNGR